MNILLGILLAGLFLCALILGASGNPKAREMVNEKMVKTVGIYTVIIIALIILLGIVKMNTP